MHPIQKKEGMKAPSSCFFKVEKSWKQGGPRGYHRGKDISLQAKAKAKAKANFKSKRG